MTKLDKLFMEKHTMVGKMSQKITENMTLAAIYK